MKRVVIKPFACSFYIYKHDELEKFKKAYNVKYDGEYGITSGNGVWVGKSSDAIGVCYHEAIHIVDWILEDRLDMQQGTLDSNKELRAYLTEFVGNEIRKHVVGK